MSLPSQACWDVIRCQVCGYDDEDARVSESGKKEMRLKESGFEGM